MNALVVNVALITFLPGIVLIASISLTTLIPVSLWKRFSCYWCKATGAFRTRSSEESINSSVFQSFCIFFVLAGVLGKDWEINHAPTQVWNLFCSVSGAMEGLSIFYGLEGEEQINLRE